MMDKLFVFFTADAINGGKLQFVCQLIYESHALLRINVLFSEEGTV